MLYYKEVIIFAAITLRPTYDFCMVLLRVGGMIEVLEPLSVRIEMHLWVKEMWNLYKDEK